MRLVVLPLLLLVYSMAARAQDAAQTSQDSVASPDSNPAQWEGRIIAGIVRDPPQQPLEQGEFDRRLGLRIGAPLALADVRTAIDSLYRTGRYHDISIEAQPSGAGVALRVVTTFNYFISGVIIDGAADPPAANSFGTATKLELGALFNPDQLEAGGGQYAGTGCGPTVCIGRSSPTTWTSVQEPRRPASISKFLPGARARVSSTSGSATSLELCLSRPKRLGAWRDGGAVCFS